VDVGQHSTWKVTTEQQQQQQQQQKCTHVSAQLWTVGRTYVKLDVL
jgi:hypothetical protein